jgi:hypothetical protein
MSWIVKNEQGILKQGLMCDVREYLEEEIGKKIGIIPELQECEEDEIVYLHSGFADDLTTVDVALIHSLGISEDPNEDTLRAIEKLLNVRVVKN